MENTVAGDPFPSRTTESLSVDEFLQRVGPIGLFQIIVVMVSSLLFCVPAYQSLMMVFIAAPLSWQCSGANPNECNSTKIFGEEDDGFMLRCDMNRSSWQYYIEKTSYSIISEFDLSCANEWLSYLANSVLFIGLVTGSIIIGWIADRYGRKWPLFGSYFLLCLVAFSISFSPNINVFLLLRTISGFFIGGIFVCNIVLCSEVVGAKYRPAASLLIWSSWIVSSCLLSLQSYYIPDWRLLNIVTTIPYIVATLGVFFVPESIRWYRSKNRLKEGEAVLRRLAKMNKKTFPENASLETVGIIDTNLHGTFKDLFHTKASTLRMIFLTLPWLAGDLLYYGLVITFSGVGGSMHRDFVLLMFPDAIVNIGNVILMSKIGRKKDVLLGYGGAGVFLFVFGALHFNHVEVEGLSVAFGILIKIFWVFSWCGIAVWTLELFPTNVRSKAMGTFFLVSQFGAAFAPWVTLALLKYHDTLPFLIMASVNVICFVNCFFLPETKGVEISDVVV